MLMLVDTLSVCSKSNLNQTNELIIFCKVILDSASSYTTTSKPSPEDSTLNTLNEPLLLAISAASKRSLENRIDQIKEYLQHNPKRLAAVAHTLGSHRMHLNHRSFCVASQNESQHSLLQFAIPQMITDVKPDVAFVFTGQGAQWVGMGKELYANIPSFRNDIHMMDVALQTLHEPPTWKIESKS